MIFTRLKDTLYTSELAKKWCAKQDEKLTKSQNIYSTDTSRKNVYYFKAPNFYSLGFTRHSASDVLDSQNFYVTEKKKSLLLLILLTKISFY